MAKKSTAVEELNQETDLTPANGGIGGIVGLTSDDLDMPYVYLVRSGSKHAKLKNGRDADAGSWYHSAKKTATKDLEIVVARAEKGETEKGGDGDDKEDMVRVWRVVALPVKNLSSPFRVSFKGMNLWYGWKPFLNMLVAEQISDVQGIVIKLSSTTATTKSGNSYEVPAITIVRDATDEEKNSAVSLASRFSNESTEG